MPIRLIDAARWYKQLPHQRSALNWLQSQLSPSLLEEFALQWRNDPKPGPRYMLMTDSGKVDRFGAQLFDLELVEHGKRIDGVTAISGIPPKRPIPIAQDYAGSGRPCPEGRFKLGAVEVGAWGRSIGNIWISVYGTEPRQAIGIHSDANRETAPGSLGCICPLDDAGMTRVASWRNAGVDTLIVDHGFKTVTRP